MHNGVIVLVQCELGASVRLASVFLRLGLLSKSVADDGLGWRLPPTPTFFSVEGRRPGKGRFSMAAGFLVPGDHQVVFGRRFVFFRFNTTPDTSPLG